MNLKRKPTTGVGASNDIDWSALDSLHVYDPAYEAWRREVAKRLRISIKCVDAMGYHEGVKNRDKAIEKLDEANIPASWDSDGSEVLWYSDVPLRRDKIPRKAKLVVKVNGDYGTYQVIRSPRVVLRGKCSPCYPMQADLDNHRGDISCYALPTEYLEGVCDICENEDPQTLRTCRCCSTRLCEECSKHLDYRARLHDWDVCQKCIRKYVFEEDIVTWRRNAKRKWMIEARTVRGNRRHVPIGHILGDLKDNKMEVV